MYLQKFSEMYLDYVNNFLTVEKFADHYGITVEHAQQIVDAGRAVMNIEQVPE